MRTHACRTDKARIHCSCTPISTLPPLGLPAAGAPAAAAAAPFVDARNGDYSDQTQQAAHGLTYLAHPHVADDFFLTIFPRFGEARTCLHFANTIIPC